MVKNPKTRDSGDGRNEQKLPFTDEEIKRMYDAWPKYGTDYHYKWTGDDLADFISLSIYTGLRISDVALFQADRMLPTGELLIGTTKGGTHVYIWVPEWLQERIKERAKKHGHSIFGAHRPTTLDIITETWRRGARVQRENGTSTCWGSPGKACSLQGRQGNRVHYTHGQSGLRRQVHSQGHALLRRTFRLVPPTASPCIRAQLADTLLS
jgi:integrase